MDEISLHLCGDIMPILKVSPVLFVSSIKVLLFFFFFFILFQSVTQVSEDYLPQIQFFHQGSY